MAHDSTYCRRCGAEQYVVRGRSDEGYWPRARISADGDGLLVEHASLGRYRRWRSKRPAELLFTENDTNARKILQLDDGPPFAKDAFHEYVINGKRGR